MKPDIVFFGESLPEDFFKCMEPDCKQCDLLIVMGTSLQVSPVNRIIQMVDKSVPQILINRELVGNGHNFDIELLGDCDEVTKYLLAHLRAGKDTSSSAVAVPTNFTPSKHYPHRWIFKNGVDDGEDDTESSDDDMDVEAPSTSA